MINAEPDCHEPDHLRERTDIAEDQFSHAVMNRK
jgi:hypothetical protein